MLVSLCPPTTIDLVLSIVTVLFSVTFPEGGDTLGGACATAELIQTTRPHVCMDRNTKMYLNMGLFCLSALLSPTPVFESACYQRQMCWNIV